MDNRSTVKGVMQNGVAAPYSFDIGAVYKEAWQSVHGFKATIWGALAWIVLMSIALSFLVDLVSTLLGLADNKIMKMLMQLVITLVILPATVGILLMAARRSVGVVVKTKQAFGYYPHFWKIALTYIAQVILMGLPLFLGCFFFAIPSTAPGMGIIFNLVAVVGLLGFIYLWQGYGYSVGLAAEKNLGIWKSLEASRRAITQHWFKIFFTYMGMGVLLIVSAIPLGIGLIWTVPMASMVQGILYRTMFGVEEER